MVQVRLRKKKTKKRVAVAATPAAKKEVSAIGKAIRALGGAAGAAMGGYVGQPLAGGALGTSLGAALSRWIGSGDYTVGSNTVVQRQLRAASSIPAMHNEGQSVMIRHREYLGEVRSAQTFTVQQSFPLNPGMSQTFPWLSTIANSFQEYRIKGLVFHYIPSSGASVSSTNAALGTVILQTSYRSTDSAPASKIEMLNEFWSNEVVPSDSMAHPVECDPKENPFNVQYVRSAAVPLTDTQLMYDLGQTHLAVSGCQTTGNVLGDLWVTYDVELKKPLVYSNTTARVDSASLLWTSGSPTATQIFGTTSVTLVGNMLVTALNNTLTIGRGYIGTFHIIVALTGNTVSVNSSGATVTGCSLVSPYSGRPSTAMDPFNVPGNTFTVFTLAIQISDPAVSPTINFNPTGTATSINSVSVAVTQYS